MMQSGAECRIDRLVCGVVGVYHDLTQGPFPRVVRVETTNRCNARCTMCPHSRMTRPKGVMAEALYRSVIDQCAANGCRQVHLHNFGEPLLDPRLPDRIAYAAGKGIRRVKFFTNGSLLSGQRARALLASGVDEIKVSIDGADRQEYERLRAGLNYDQVVGNIRDFVNERDRRNLAGPRVIVTCCLTSDRTKTAHRLADVVDDFAFVQLHNWADQDSARRGARKPCSRIWETFNVLWDGRAVPCCLDFDGKVVLGDLTADGTIAAIWRNTLYDRMRRLHRTGRQAAIGICRDCSKSFLWRRADGPVPTGT